MLALVLGFRIPPCDWLMPPANGKDPRRVPVPMVGQVKHSFFVLSQPKNECFELAREGHHELSQLFDWQGFIYHRFYCSNGSW